MSYDPSEAKRIFLQAVEITSVSERAAYVSEACSGRPDLLSRVEALLNTMTDSDSFFDRSGVDNTLLNEESSPVLLDFLEQSEIEGSLGRLGSYEVLDVIGHGGMGIVLRATDRKLNRVVAIKVLVPELARDPQSKRRFLREAKAAAAVSHDHVVTIHGVEEGHSATNQLPFLVMECIVARTLQQKIDRSGALELNEILRIGMQISAGLAAAHKQGLVHRDIKPANILLENGIERVKITDFGLARSKNDLSITQVGLVSGTPQYMSPEQAIGASVDHRSDLFSLGSVLYIMCTGMPAFRADSAVAVLRRVCDETPRLIEELNQEIPNSVVTVVNRLLSKKPEERFQSADEVAALLERCLAQSQHPTLAGEHLIAQQQSLDKLSPSQERIAEIVAAVFGITLLVACSVVVGRGIWWVSLFSFLLGLYIVWMIYLRESKRGTSAVSTIPKSSSTKSPSPPALTQLAPQGTISRAWQVWWAERDRWTTIAAQATLILIYLFCMIFFMSTGTSGGFDEDRHVTFGFRIGVPDPWFQFEVYPRPNIPFRYWFNLVSWSAVIGLGGCLAYYAYWRIEKVRNPAMSRFDRPAVMLGCWGLGAIVAVAIGSWQGFTVCAEPRVDAPAVMESDSRSTPFPPVDSTVSLQRELAEAASNGKADQVKQALDAGASINSKDANGKTPLMKAVAGGHRALALALLLRGASLTEQDDRGQTAIMVAVDTHDSTLLQLIWDLSRASFESDANQRRAKLSTFSGAEQSLLVGHEIDLFGLDIFLAEKLRDELGETASIKAARSGDWECFSLLANYTESLLARDNEGRTVLMHAVLGGHLNELKWRELYENLATQPYFGVAEGDFLYSGRMLIFDLEGSLSILDQDEKSVLQLAEENGHKAFAGTLRLHLEAIVANQTAAIEHGESHDEKIVRYEIRILGQDSEQGFIQRHVRLRSLALQALGR